MSEAPISLKAINGASASDKRPKLNKDGDYACEISAIKWAKSFESGGVSYVIETVVIESDNPEIRVGQDRSITINRLDAPDDKKYLRDKAFGNLKGFVAAVMADALDVEIDVEAEFPAEGDTWEGLVKQTYIDDGKGLVGAKFRVKIFNMRTGKNKENIFAKPTFRAYKQTKAA